MIAKRLGVYGGTFSPPHKGHMQMGKAFIESGIIDKLLIMPTFLPPHKFVNDEVTPDNRIDMLNIAFDDLIKAYGDRIIICDYEIKKGDVSYTVNTVKHFINECEELIIFCGSDMLMTVDRWYHADELLSMCSIAYNSRLSGQSDSDELKKKAEYINNTHGTRIYNLSVDTTEVSSSKLREMIAMGDDTDLYLDEKVRAYIDEHDLYRA